MWLHAGYIELWRNGGNLLSQKAAYFIGVLVSGEGIEPSIT